MFRNTSASSALTFSLKAKFTRLGRFEKMIAANPHVKDYTKNQVIGANIEDARDKFKRDHSISGVKLLSEGVDIPRAHVKLGKDFRVDKRKINKLIKRHVNKDIDKAQKDSYEYLVENDYLQLNYSKIEENKRLIHETEQFKKLYFEKQEIKRLLKLQQRKVEHNLPLSAIPEALIPEAQRFAAYTESNLDLKNTRITNMLSGTSKENKKLALLISSGLLDTTKNIQQIITASTQIIASESKLNAQNSTSSEQTYKSHPDQQFEDFIVSSSESTQSANKQQGSTAKKTTATTRSSQDVENSELEFNDDNNVETTDVYAADHIVETLLVENASSSSVPAAAGKSQAEMMEFYAEKISKMGFDITLSELGFVDFEALALFFNEFVASSPEDKLRTLSKIQLMESLRSYENELFDKYRNNDISLRVKGQLEYKDLTAKEQLNYVKYHTKKPSDVFLMMNNLPAAHLTPAVVSQMTARIATFKFESKQNFLAIISNHNYRALLRHALNNLKAMSNDELVDLVWSLGKIHQHEHGVVYEKLFNKIMENVTLEISNRIDQISLRDISFMSRGYCKLHHLGLNSQLNSIMVEGIRDKLTSASREGESLSVFAIQGLLLYTSFVNTPESKSVLGDLLLPLLSKEEILNDIDRASLSEIFLSLASVSTTHKQEIHNFLTASTARIISISKQLDTDTISDVMVVANACNFADKQLFQELKKRTTFNFREQKPCSEVSVSKLLCAFAQHDLDRTLSRHLDGPKSSQSAVSLFDNLLLFSYFPTLLFHQQSPQYSFYNRIAKEIDRVKSTFTPKWIALSVFGVSAVNYKNLDFLDDCARTILSDNNNNINDQTNNNNSKIKDISQLKYEGAVTNNLNELAMVLFGYSNMKRSSNVVQKQLIDRIRNLFMENAFQKATPLAWAQFFNTLANTFTRDEIDEIETQFAQIVFYDKIQHSLRFLSLNMRVSLLFSLSRLCVDPEITTAILESFSISELNNFQMYLVNLALLNSQANTLQEQQQQNEDNKPVALQFNNEKFDGVRIKEVEEYMVKTIASKYDFAENSRFTYEQTCIRIKSLILENLLEKFTSIHTTNTHVLTNHFDPELMLQIDFFIPKTKTAIFLYTAEHCLTHEVDAETDQEESQDIFKKGKQQKKPVEEKKVVLSGLYQVKEEILTAHGYDVIRIFAHEFNSIGLSASIEQERKDKKFFIYQLLHPIFKSI